MPLTNPPLRSTQVYVVSNVVPDRTFDPTSTTTTETNQVLATLIQDLKAAGILS